MLFQPWFAELVGKAFVRVPDEAVHVFAEKVVRFSSKHSAEREYRSIRTAWTRWSQDIARHPWRMRRGRRVRIRRVVWKKCTQSGVTESVLNVMRWFAKYAPRNIIYSINSEKESENIRNRFVDTLAALGEELFSGGQDAEDLGTYVLHFAAFIAWFIGSGSDGAYANKYAALAVTDEFDDHVQRADRASTADLVEERIKTQEDDGLHYILSKPKWEDGPIDRAHAAGDQFEFWVPCPHCGTYQALKWDRVKFGHCREDGGRWDLERVLFETYYECANDKVIDVAEDGSFVYGQHCRIYDAHKEWMIDRGVWVLVKFGDPETVSLWISDLYSPLSTSTLGIIAKEFVNATEQARRGNLQPLQTWTNGRMGLGMAQKLEKLSLADVKACLGTYRRGVVPRKGLVLVAGFDVGLFVNTRFSVLGIDPQTYEAYVIDYGSTDGPESIPMLLQKTYLCPATGQKQPVIYVFADCRYRRDEVYTQARMNPGRVVPLLGLKLTHSVRSIGWTQVPHEAPGFGVVTFVDQDAKFHLFIFRMKKRSDPKLHLPEDAEEGYLVEFSTQRILKDPISGQGSFSDTPSGPDHYADTVKVALVGFDYVTDGPRTRAAAASGAPVADVALALLGG